MSEDSSSKHSVGHKTLRSRIPWNPVIAIVVLVVTYIVSSLIAQLGLSAYVSMRGWNEDQVQAWLDGSVVPQFAYVVIIDIVLIGMIWLFLRRYKAGFKLIGLIKPKLKDLATGLIAFPVYMLASTVIVGVLLAIFTGIDPDQRQELGFDNPQGPLALLITFVSLVILPPLVEEIVFRGVLFTSLRKYIRFIGAAVITSIIFACAHLSASSTGLLYVAAIDTFILSMVLCYVRDKTGSLWPAITVHALKNGLAFMSLYIIVS